MNIIKMMIACCCWLSLLLLAACSDPIANESSKQNTHSVSVLPGEANQNTNQADSRIINQQTPRVEGAWRAPSIMGTENIDSSLAIAFFGPTFEVFGPEQLLQWRVVKTIQVGQFTTQEQTTTIKYRHELNAPWLNDGPTDRLDDRSLTALRYFRSPQGVWYGLWVRNGILYFSHKTVGTDWSPEIEIAPGTWGHLAFDDQDNILMIWSHPVLAGLSHVTTRVYRLTEGWVSHVNAIELNYPDDASNLPISSIDVAYHNGVFSVIWSDPTGAAKDILYHATLDPDIGWSEKTLLDHFDLVKGDRITAIKTLSNHSSNQLILVVGITNTTQGRRRVRGISQLQDNWLTPVTVDIHQLDFTQSTTLEYQLSRDEAAISIAWVEVQVRDQATYHWVRARQYSIASGWSPPISVSPMKLALNSDPNIIIPRVDIKALSVARNDERVSVAWVEASEATNTLYVSNMSNQTTDESFSIPELIHQTKNASVMISQTQLGLMPDQLITATWLEQIPGADNSIEYRMMSADRIGNGNTVIPQ